MSSVDRTTAPRGAVGVEPDPPSPQEALVSLHGGPGSTPANLFAAAKMRTAAVRGRAPRGHRSYSVAVRNSVRRAGMPRVSSATRGVMRHDRRAQERQSRAQEWRPGRAGRAIRRPGPRDASSRARDARASSPPAAGATGRRRGSRRGRGRGAGPRSRWGRSPRRWGRPGRALRGPAHPATATANARGPPRTPCPRPTRRRPAGPGWPAPDEAGCRSAGRASGAESHTPWSLRRSPARHRAGRRRTGTLREWRCRRACRGSGARIRRATPVPARGGPRAARRGSARTHCSKGCIQIPRSIPLMWVS